MPAMNELCTNKTHRCIGRDKFPINGKLDCCKEQIEDEYLIAQSVIDAIEDCSATKYSIERVCSRISFAADTIDNCQEDDREEIFPEFKRFALLTYQNRERILEENEILNLVFSFVNVVKNYFHQSFMSNNLYYRASNTIDSIKADLYTIEMALGICVLMPYNEETLDDIFF